MCLAVPGKIISIHGEDLLTRTGRVDFDGVIKEVSLAATPEATAGHYVLVHAGLAISIVDETEARQTLEYLQQIDELNNELGGS
ncbi:MAG: Hydrogenase maturation factor HybG [Phycisphaerae bacterium]|nr:Hydrogenase maturation factor HybG [Phycisphaerae bacterium]